MFTPKNQTSHFNTISHMNQSMTPQNQSSIVNTNLRQLMNKVSTIDIEHFNPVLDDSFGERTPKQLPHQTLSKQSLNQIKELTCSLYRDINRCNEL